MITLNLAVMIGMAAVLAVIMLTIVRLVLNDEKHFRVNMLIEKAKAMTACGNTAGADALIKRAEEILRKRWW